MRSPRRPPGPLTDATPPLARGRSLAAILAASIRVREVEMLANVRLGANIPVRTVATARAFYEGVLGVTPVRIQDAEVLYRAGGTLFAIYETEAAGKAGHTLATFSGVEDLDAMVAALRERGVVFEEYDVPGVRTVGGIAQLGPDRVAWFRDPDGNLLAMDDARL